MPSKINASLFAAFALAAISTTAQAQVGYQVSLLNAATGEPRANVTVNAQVTITDSQDSTIYSGSQQATTNDFGVLSLAVGDASTFANADTGKMPFFISVSVDGTLIGRSQILTVPVAEVANKLKSSFTKEDLVGTWVYRFIHPDPELSYQNYTDIFIFSPNGTFEAQTITPSSQYNDHGEYEIKGDVIVLYYDNGNSGFSTMRWYKSKICRGSGFLTKQ